jgi:FkbM family methyltransferase
MKPNAVHHSFVSQIGEALYVALVRSRSAIAKRLFRDLRQVLVWLGDPLVTMNVEGLWLVHNLSHQFPLYYSLFPNFDRALPRICAHIKKLEGSLTLIDVGSNIGDTVCLIAKEVSGRYLCIEGDPTFFELLKLNTQSFVDSITYAETFLGEEATEKTLTVTKQRGTLQLTRARDHAIRVQLQPLDRLLDGFPEFLHCNCLKVDTDGYDLQVLRGARELLRRSHPALFVEFYPELLTRNGEDPLSLFSLLQSLEYEYCLFYNNTGNAVRSLRIWEQKYIEDLLLAIDNQTVFYYDILVLHQQKKHLFEIIDSELQRSTS